MPYKDPNNANLITVMLALILATWGCMVSYLLRLKAGTITKFSVIGFLVEMVISGFACVMIYLLCMQFRVPELLTVFISGMAGHSGASTISVLKRISDSFIGSLFNVNTKKGGKNEN